MVQPWDAKDLTQRILVRRESLLVNSSFIAFCSLVIGMKIRPAIVLYMRSVIAPSNFSLSETDH